MLSIPNSGLLGLYWLIAICASFCSAVCLLGCVADACSRRLPGALTPGE